MSPMPHTHYLHHLHRTRVPAHAPGHFYSPIPAINLPHRHGHFLPPVPAIDLPHRNGHFLPPVPAIGMTHSTGPHAPGIMPPSTMLPSPNSGGMPSLESGNVVAYPHPSTPFPAGSTTFSNAASIDTLSLLVAALVVLTAIGAILWWMMWLMKGKDRTIKLEVEEEREEKDGWMREMMRRWVRGKKARGRREEEGLLWEQ